MRILILEDDDNKASRVCELVSHAIPGAIQSRVANFREFYKNILSTKFDFIIADLLVPSFGDSKDPVDMTREIINSVRDRSVVNYRTPMVALTKFDEKAEEKFRELNMSDISIITYDETSAVWGDALVEKIFGCIPPKHYDFVILCALAKEADGFVSAGYEVRDRKVVNGTDCREIRIGSYEGVLITASRMGLVSAAIACSNAISFFSPRLICMSGISAGVHEKADIYDVVIPDICFQNDAGKWSNGKFELEAYPVQIDHILKLEIQRRIEKEKFLASVMGGISLNRDEYPENCNQFKMKVYCAPASSGSSVVADADIAVTLKGQHRKLSAFEMESYAVYEAARLSHVKPKFFSAKAVVDNGTETKGDEFHRVACLVSAKVVGSLIEGGIVDV